MRIIQSEHSADHLYQEFKRECGLLSVLLYLNDKYPDPK